MKFYTVQPTTTTLLVFGILLALLSQPVYGQAVGTRKILQILRSRSVLNRSYIKTSDGLMMPRREKMKCRLWQNHIHHEDKSKVSHRWECSVDQPKVEGYINKVIVGIDNQNMNDFLEANGAESGKSMLVMSDMDVQEDRIVIDTDQVIRIEDYVPVEGESTGRRLTPTNGILNTLVVRVNTQDRSPPSASQLSSDIFKDDYCLKSQYGKCSYDKLQVMEYESESIAGVPTAADGVIDIEVPATSEGSSKEDIQDLANQAVRQMFNTNDPGSIFDLVLFCMPPGLDDYLAYAYVGRWDSYYNDEWCLKASSQMHEVGHNLGLQHSGEYFGSAAEQEYGDQTGMMGFSYFEDDAPKMCFNPAKNWQLGWYDDKNIEINLRFGELSTEPTSYLLNGFIDYGDDTSDRYIVLKIDDFYIGYNRATEDSFNEGTVEAPDKVTVVEKLGTSLSKMAAKLGINGTFVIDTGFMQIEVRYVSNSGGEGGKDAVIELKLIGEPEFCEVGEGNSEILVRIITDQYPTETSWGIADGLGYVFFKEAGSYNQQFQEYTETVSNLCRGYEYTFVIEDTFGDGICCSWGEGSYTGLFEGSTIFQGGEFGLQEVETFTLPLLDIAPNECVDDSSFEFRGLSGKNCDFLSQRKTSTIFTYCNKKANAPQNQKKVYEYCRATCDSIGIDEACPN